MKNGIYEASFTTNKGTLGTAAVMVKDGAFSGADAVQFFRGDIEQNGAELRVMMEVTRHNFAVDSAFGQAPVFTIRWSGEDVGDTTFRLEARPEDVDVALYVTGKLLKEFD